MRNTPESAVRGAWARGDRSNCLPALTDMCNGQWSKRVARLLFDESRSGTANIINHVLSYVQNWESLVYSCALQVRGISNHACRFMTVHSPSQRTIIVLIRTPTCCMWNHHYFSYAAAKCRAQIRPTPEFISHPTHTLIAFPPASRVILHCNRTHSLLSCSMTAP